VHLRAATDRDGGNSTTATTGSATGTTGSAVANTLLYGADHLSKGNVVLPPDNTSPDEDFDEDALAL
jgi:hypothetical protein